MSQWLVTPSEIRHQTDQHYPFKRIWINGRHVSIESIVQESALPRSAFEEATFRFIHEWLSGQETFEMATSGSTGTPKKISIARHQMIASARRTAEKIKLEQNSLALVCLDPRYIAGKMMLVRCLTLGLGIMAVDPVANPLVKIPIDDCVQFTAFVPYQIQAVLESKHPHLLNDLDTVLIGGAPMSETIRAHLDRYQCACYETYGMTETVSHIALRRVNSNLKQPYFETLPGIRITLDERGCLVITADYLEKPVVTNDLAEIIEPGRFVWIGRWDSVINTGGIKVLPETVERQLAPIMHKNGLSNRFFIAALPDDKLGNKIVLIIEGVQFSSEFLDQSLTELGSIVSSYEVPREVYTVGKFHTTTTGKIDRIQTLAGVTLPLSSK